MRCIGKMEDVVKAIAVVIMTVVSQFIADLASAMIKNDSWRFGVQLLHSNAESVRKALTRREHVIVEDPRRGALLVNHGGQSQVTRYP